MDALVDASIDLIQQWYRRFGTRFVRVNQVIDEAYAADPRLCACLGARIPQMRQDPNPRHLRRWLSDHQNWPYHTPDGDFHFRRDRGLWALRHVAELV